MKMQQSENSEEPKSKNCYNGTKFMQPLIPDFLNNFSIPESFVGGLEMGLDDRQPDNVVLMTDDKHNWAVKLEGGRRFGDGWKDFCLHHDLEVGDFLVFTHLFNFIFQVTVYDPTSACARQFGKGIERRGGFKFNEGFTCKRNSVEDEATTTVVPSARHQYPRYRVNITSPSTKCGIVYLPVDLVRSNHLYQRSCDLKLVDGEGNSWKVKLKYKKSSGQPYIGRGWREFQVANSFMPGHAVIFQMVKDGKRPVFKCFRLRSEKKA